MRFATTQLIKTSASSERLLDTLDETFSPISESVERGRKSVVAKNIEATFGSINRDDQTTLTLRQKSNGWLVTAETEYKPSKWFWVILVLSLLGWIIGIFIPIGIYLWHKNMVKNGVENALRKVNDELEEDEVGQSIPSSVNTSANNDLLQLASLLQQGLITHKDFEAAKRKALGLSPDASNDVDNFLDTDPQDSPVFVKRNGKVSPKPFTKAALLSRLEKLLPTDEFSNSQQGPWVTKDKFFG